MNKVVVNGQLYIDGLPFDDEEDYWKLLADVYEPDSYDDDDERYDGLTLEERNK